MLKISLMKLGIAVSLASCLVFSAWGAQAPSASLSTGSVQILVAGRAATTFTENDLANLPRSSITAGVHDEKPSLWEGVALAELLRRAGAPTDKPLRGREMAKFVRVTAADGYQVVFSLTELDAAFGDRHVLLVDRQDGHPLSRKDGPFRLVVEGDKRPARWVREVETIEIVDGSSGLDRTSARTETDSGK
ncbi:molybdopterin-dependent oxidoreductase [Rhodanobacter sp. MP7CTX1]|uniref:molybdopterin-dependent oxidoreductase n=1 Tax=Rhodanobacter sp. MP7CTX1 TaxID=2723084 RepID=UPI0016179B18|nr:molybdopterin-dependent oxidoreductase [Rhodanobacter sp. MP7CTX1]MBB6186155.1 DMSO/TMAO reductase YedYZ molybdopterin-dependent catalytic subunit [Rhodanobacter sp. MP7CTX1]